jgi:hypothetical protein
MGSAHSNSRKLISKSPYRRPAAERLADAGDAARKPRRRDDGRRVAQDVLRGLQAILRELRTGIPAPGTRVTRFTPQGRRLPDKMRGPK